MQQATRRLVLVLGGAFSMAAGLLVAACSTDNGTSSSGGLPTIDGSKPDTGKQTGDDDDDDTDGGGDSGPAPDCGAAPFLVNNSADAGIFCPFQAAKDAGNCTVGQECCQPGTFGAPSFCANIDKSVEANNETAARFTTCKNAVPDASAPEGGWDPVNNFNAAWECSDSTQCPTGNVCCATSQPTADATNKVNVGPNQFTKGIPVACGAKQLFKQGGTRCAAACNSLEIPLCSKNDNCAAGQECQPMAGTANSGISTRYLGYCVTKP